MTNATETAVTVTAWEGADAFSLGVVIVKKATRSGYAGVVEVHSTDDLDKGRRDEFRAAMLRSSTIAFSFAEGERVVRGPYLVESFASRKGRPGYELTLSAAGDLVVEGGPAEEGEASVSALVQSARDSVQSICSNVIRTRSPEVPLDMALSAVLTGAIEGVLRTMSAASPNAAAEDVAEAIAGGARALLGLDEEGSNRG